MLFYSVLKLNQFRIYNDPIQNHVKTEWHILPPGIGNSHFLLYFANQNALHEVLYFFAHHCLLTEEVAIWIRNWIQINPTF